MDKALFMSQIFEIDILMYLHVLISLEYENHFITGYGVCQSVFICITQKEIIAEF